MSRRPGADKIRGRQWTSANPERRDLCCALHGARLGRETLYMRAVLQGDHADSKRRRLNNEVAGRFDAQLVDLRLDGEPAVVVDKRGRWRCLRGHGEERVRRRGLGLQDELRLERDELPVQRC